MKKVDIDKNKNKINEILEWVITGIIAISLSFFVLSFVQIAKVNGQSMDNTLHDSQRLLVYKKAYKNNIPKYGDIVVTKSSNSHKSLIKRVIGVEGDTLEIIDNKVYLNGELLVEDYIKEEMRGNENLKVEIPKDYIFVMGDNRNNSADSRNSNIGLINYKEGLVGKILFKN